MDAADAFLRFFPEDVYIRRCVEATDPRQTLEGLRVALEVACELIQSKGELERKVMASRGIAAALRVRQCPNYTGSLAREVRRRGARGDLAGVAIDAQAWGRTWATFARVTVSVAKAVGSDWWEIETILLVPIFSLLRFRELWPQTIIDALRANKALEASLYAEVKGTADHPVAGHAPRGSATCMALLYLYRNWTQYPAMHMRCVFAVLEDISCTKVGEALEYLREMAKDAGIREKFANTPRNCLEKLALSYRQNGGRVPLAILKVGVEAAVALQQAAFDQRESICCDEHDGVSSADSARGRGERPSLPLLVGCRRRDAADAAKSSPKEPLLWFYLKAGLAVNPDPNAEDNRPWMRLWSIALRAVLEQHAWGRADALDLTRVRDGRLNPLVASLYCVHAGDVPVAYAQLVECILDDPRRTPAFDALFFPCLGAGTIVVLMIMLHHSNARAFTLGDEGFACYVNQPAKVRGGAADSTRGGVVSQKAEEEAALLLRVLARMCDHMAPVFMHDIRVAWDAIAVSLLRNLAFAFESNNADAARWTVRVAASFGRVYGVISVDGRRVDLAACEQGLAGLLQAGDSAGKYADDTQYVLEWVRSVRGSGVEHVTLFPYLKDLLMDAIFLTMGGIFGFDLGRPTIDAGLYALAPEDEEWARELAPELEEYLCTGSSAFASMRDDDQSEEFRDAVLASGILGARDPLQRARLRELLSHERRVFEIGNVPGGIKMLLRYKPSLDEKACESAGELLGYYSLTQNISAATAGLVLVARCEGSLPVIAAALRTIRAHRGEDAAVAAWKATGRNIYDSIPREEGNKRADLLRQLGIWFVAPEQMSSRPKVGCPVCQFKDHPVVVHVARNLHTCMKAPVQSMASRQVAAKKAPAKKGAPSILKAAAAIREASSRDNRASSKGATRAADTDKPSTGIVRATPSSPAPSAAPSEAKTSDVNQGTPAGDSNPAKPACAACGKGDVKLLKCGACLVVRYCSRECQKGAWPQHRQACAGQR